MCYNIVTMKGEIDMNRIQITDCTTKAVFIQNCSTIKELQNFLECVAYNRDAEHEIEIKVL